MSRSGRGRRYSAREHETHERARVLAARPDSYYADLEVEERERAWSAELDAAAALPLPTGADVERQRMEHPILYCPVCRRPTPTHPDSGVIDLARRLVRHLFDSHDPYFGAQLRAALCADPDRDTETAEDPFHPVAEAW